MDNELEEKPKKASKPKKKTYSGIVLKPIKIGSKYDFTGKYGQKVNGLSFNEYQNYKQNKIIK